MNLKKLNEELERAIREASGEEFTFANELDQDINKGKTNNNYDPNEPFTYQSKEGFYSDDNDVDKLFVSYEPEEGFYARGELMSVLGKSFDELVENVISEAGMADAVEFKLEYEPDGDFDPNTTEDEDVGAILITYYYSEDSEYDEDEDW